MAITGTTITYDQEKYLSAKLIARSYLKLVFSSLMDKEQQPEGTGRTAYFVRYKRMNVPLVPLADDGADPTDSAFSLEQVSVSLDEWGDVVKITNVAKLTAAHPVMTQALELLADNAARVMDREIGIVLMAGTNVQYAVSAVSRTALATTDKISDTVIHRARITLANRGAPPRGGPQRDAQQVNASGSRTFEGLAYVAVCGEEVLADIQAPSTSLGTWAAVAMYANAKALYTSEVGMWLGFRWVGSNFIPRFTMLGNATTAAAAGSNWGGITGLTVAATTGGSLTSASTYYVKVTRKDLLRGYEEDISIEHTISPGGSNTRLTFTMPSTAGYVYNVYFGDTTGDTNLKQFATTNLAASAAINIDAVPSTTVTPPPSNNATGPVSTVYPIFIFAEAAVNWVGFYGIKTYVTPDVSTPDNVLRRRRLLGYTFFAKAMIRDQDRLMRIEVASTYN